MPICFEYLPATDTELWTDEETALDPGIVERVRQHIVWAWEQNRPNFRICVADDITIQTIDRSEILTYKELVFTLQAFHCYDYKDKNGNTVPGKYYLVAVSSDGVQIMGPQVDPTSRKILAPCPVQTIRIGDQYIRTK